MWKRGLLFIILGLIIGFYGREVIKMELSLIEIDNQEYALRDSVARENFSDIEYVTEAVVKVPSDNVFFDFDTSKMTVGLIQPDGSIGSDAGTGAWVSDFLAVEGGQTYFFSRMNRAAFYDANKVHSSAGGSMPVWTGDPWVPPFDGYVRLNSTPANIPYSKAIVGYDVTIESIKNIDEVIDLEETFFEFSTAYMTSGLIDQSNGNIVNNAGTNAWVSDYLPVSAGMEYKIKGINRAGYYSSDKTFIKMLPNVYNGEYFTFPQNGYVRLNCVLDYFSSAEAIVGRTTAIDNTARSELNIGNKYVELSGNLSSGQSLTLQKHNNIKKNNTYVFSGKITNFSSLKIGHGTSSIYDSYIEITNSDVIVHNMMGSDQTVTYTHGLTISGYIKVEIKVKDTVTTPWYMDCDITILSGGSEFRQTDVLWNGCGEGYIFVQSVGSNLTDCRFIWGCEDLGKKIWFIGDSYTMILEDRWPYYMERDGVLDNILLNGFGGERSAQAISAVQDMLDIFCKPKYIVWTLGMNDGGDSSSAYQSDWYTAITTFIGLCSDNGITPILATVPTVPNINNEKKNNWIRVFAGYFGCRYIDFAKAVGASSSGQWYVGMLSSDNVHPTALGAKALYNQILLDLPEVMFN